MKEYNTLINKLSSKKIAQYLHLNGWLEDVPLFGGRVRQFLSPDSTDAVVLPMDSSFSDYVSAMSRVIEIIAQFENVSIKGMFSKLINPSYDILKWRISDQSTINGSISFNSMEHNIQFVKDILGSACLDILEPTPFHNKLYVKDVQEQISKYNFGQTEVGSFILNVLCPLGYYQYQLFDPEMEQLPLSRQINLNVLGNIGSIQKSAKEGSSEIRDNVAESKISVNFLSALSCLYEENKDSELTIMVDWDKSIPNPATTISMIRLNPRCIDKVMEVIEEFTPKNEKNVAKVYYGKIINIGAEAEVDNRTMVDVKVAVVGEGFRTATVNASLNYSEYFEIVDQAFQSGADVKIKGIKMTSARSIKLDNATIEIVQ